MKLRSIVQAGFLIGGFFATYSMVVENPLATNRLDLRAYVGGVLSQAIDSSDLRVSRLLIAVMALFLAHAAVRFVRRVLEAQA